MITFTREQIEGTRDYFRQEGYEEVHASLRNRTFSYFVVPQSAEPNLPDFVMRLTGEVLGDYVLGISDSVAQKYRPYTVAHEFIEFCEIGIDEPNIEETQTHWKHY